MINNFFIFIGRNVQMFFSFLGGLFNLAVQTVYLSFLPPFKKDRFFEQAK